jgi:hypothetical protein
MGVNIRRNMESGDDRTFYSQRPQDTKWRIINVIIRTEELQKNWGYKYQHNNKIYYQNKRLEYLGKTAGNSNPDPALPM